VAAGRVHHGGERVPAAAAAVTSAAR
jgi:hypothetical protein